MTGVQTIAVVAGSDLHRPLRLNNRLPLWRWRTGGLVALLPFIPDRGLADLALR